MIEIKGTHNTAVCYCSELEASAEGQIRAVCDREEFSDCKIRIMPDVHAGKGCTIGTTMTVTDKVVPGMVGVDIGCGMEAVRIEENKVDFNRLDKLIRMEIPCGREVRKLPHRFNREIDLDALCCAKRVNLERATLSIGTLGGGNHFIEIDRDEENRLWLVVHSGSRHLGTEVAQYYQEEGFRAIAERDRAFLNEQIAALKAQGKSKEIEREIKKLKKQRADSVSIPRELAYVEGTRFEEYLHDMKITQQFAVLNRRAITEVILSGMKLTETERFTTVHNYIDTEEKILRKGSVSAKTGEKLLIPINMRDGSLICIGKGNPAWNFSAPHGAGRIMSRKDAKEHLSMSEYRAEMEGIYTTCISHDTIDESPMAYKDIKDIEEQITPTAEIVSHIRPIYNFKAAE